MVPSQSAATAVVQAPETIAAPRVAMSPGWTGEPQDRAVAMRLHRAAGQLAGVAGMYDNGRPCVEILDQLSAVSASVDMIAALLVEDHLCSSARKALADNDIERAVSDLSLTLRRYIRTR